MEIDTLTDSISLFPGLSFNAVEEGGLELGMAWFTFIGGLGGGAALGVVDLAVFFFAKKTRDKDHFLPCGVKGRSMEPQSVSTYDARSFIIRLRH